MGKKNQSRAKQVCQMTWINNPASSNRQRKMPFCFFYLPAIEINIVNPMTKAEIINQIVTQTGLEKLTVTVTPDQI